MDPNSYQAVERYVQSFERVADIIRAKNPNCIIAPMLGAVPFIDVLNIIDDSFPNERVEYVPASNRVHEMRRVLRAVFECIIEERAPDGGSFLSLDEVVSGNSCQRVQKQFDTARTNYANRKTIELFKRDADFRDEKVRAFRDDLQKRIGYQTIGIVDSRMERAGKPKSAEYQKLVAEGVVIPVETDCIVTMDKHAFFPFGYKQERDEKGRTVYLPEIQTVSISHQYIDFLTLVAKIVGKDPETVTVHNIAKIRDSGKWVPDELKRLKKK